ncbi:MAG: 4-hydroxybenzoate octaprenyltransferase [Alphaproteobacteria bacterium]
MIAKPADAAPGNWVDRFVPSPVQPFLRLARWDRPIGFWLLIWPCWWAITLAVPAANQPWPDQTLLLLFALGAIAMRGAGCTFNDLVDRHIDARVERTRSRPLPAGQVSVRQAWAFLVAQSLVGLMVLLTLNGPTILLGILSLGLVAAYPFMKRLTDWPQAWLGLTFNWGALMGYSAVTGTLGLAPLLLYAGSVLWTMGYDTVYAHQDKEDDALIGVKSSALKLGYQTRPWVAVFYSGTLVCFLAAGTVAGLSGWFYLGMAAAAAHLAWQVVRLDIDRPALCLLIFRANRDFGALVFVALLLGLA